MPGRSVEHGISIHSPHTRGDGGASDDRCGLFDFNPLPSYEGRPAPTYEDPAVLAFQSTPLIRGETLNKSADTPILRYFNPLPSYEGRRMMARCDTTKSYFNPLPSYEGRQNFLS